MRPQIKSASDIKPAMDYLTKLYINANPHGPDHSFIESNANKLEPLLVKLWDKFGATPIGAIKRDVFGFVFALPDSPESPAGIVSVVNKQNKRSGDFEDYFKFYSHFIDKTKGEKFSAISKDVKGLSLKFNKKYIRPISPNDMFWDHRFSSMSITKFRSEHGSYFRVTDSGLDLKEVFASMEAGETTPCKSLVDWYESEKRRSEETERRNEGVVRTRDHFAKRSVLITDADYACDKPFLVSEVSFNFVAEMGIYTPTVHSHKWVADIKELTAEYPHIVGAHNMIRISGKESGIFSRVRNDYSSEYNMFSFGKYANSLFAVKSSMFPATLIGDADDKKVDAVEVKVEDKGGVSALDF